jgi:class 3 adenylate cyclase
VTDRDVRYCTTADGVSIAYCVYGDGPPLLVCPLFVESFSLDHLFPEYEAFMDALGTGRKLIRYDMRGTGLSDRDPESASNDDLTSDVEAVVNAVDEEKLAIWAPGVSGLRAITYTARHPDRVSHLILYGTYSDPTLAYPGAVADAMAELAVQNWQLASQMFADMSIREKYPDAAVSIGEIIRRSTNGETIARLVRGNMATGNVTDLLPTITVPSVVIHRQNDESFPFALGQKVARSIPGAKLVPLVGTANDFALEDPKSVLKAVDAFMERAPVHDEPPAQGAFRTILFTDLVGHTEMMSRLGDERGRAVLREHEDITRNVLKEYGGTEVKTMGDGFMASFGSVTKAVECAIALQKAIDERNQGVGVHHDAHLRVRCGLNAGEPIEEEGDLFGATVILASRIAAKADGGEILVANAVRELCSGKGFLFADRGEFVAKGFEEPVRVYEVRWRE